MGKLSAFITTRDSSAVLLRTIGQLAGCVDELVVLDTGSSDDTVVVAERLAKNHGMRFVDVHVNPMNTPSLYVVDEEHVWGGAMPGPFSGEWLLVDWSFLFNCAMDRCTGDYVVRIDADDVVSDSSNLARMASLLDNLSNVDVVSFPYNVLDVHGDLMTVNMMPRLFRRGTVRYEWVMHEQVRPRNPDKELVIANGLSMTDVGDSPGKVKIPNRNAKVLLLELQRCEREGILREPLFDLTAAHELVDVMPDLALQILSPLDLHFEGQWLAEVLMHIGSALEAKGDFSMALDAHLSSISTTETSNAHARAGIVQHKLGNHDLVAHHSKCARELADKASNFGVWLPWVREAERLAAGVT